MQVELPLPLIYKKVTEYIKCMYLFQLPELLETIKPKLEMIGFKNFSSISGKNESLDSAHL